MATESQFPEKDLILADIEAQLAEGKRLKANNKLSREAIAGLPAVQAVFDQALRVKQEVWRTLDDQQSTIRTGGKDASIARQAEKARLDFLMKHGLATNDEVLELMNRELVPSARGVEVRI